VTPEIRAFEYALGLFAVLIGLAVTDVAASLHHLLRSRHRVRWDPLALLAALYALLLAVGMWFDLWGVRNFAATRHFFFYLSLVAIFLVLFLIAAVSLPDKPESDCDLRLHYEGSRRYYWALVALFQLAYFAFGLYFTGGHIFGSSMMTLLTLNNLILPWVIALALMAWRSRPVQYAGFGLQLLAFAHHYAPYQIN
jgi:hypothetical protein